MRPQQWVKNLFVFAGVIFAQKLFTAWLWEAMLAFVIFCGLSGAIYLLNDVVDRGRDVLHPQKSRRPIASGRVSVQAAIITMLLVLCLGGMASAWLSGRFLAVAAIYVVLLGGYSLGLKHVVILDALIVAIGFVLRAVAGAVAVQAEISGWLLICTVLIALFLALGKRRHEFLMLTGEAARHRPVLAEYSLALLDQMIAVVTASTLTAYALYTMAPETVARFNTHLLPITLPFVLYGIFRYLYLLYRREMGGNPSDLFLNDRPLIVNTLLWMLAVVAIIYGHLIW
jgi:4-hydroxybenzoate polyprenyltransferase